MPVRVACPSCGEHVSLPETAGSTTPCPSCSNPIPIPGELAEPVATAPPPPPAASHSVEDATARLAAEFPWKSRPRPAPPDERPELGSGWRRVRSAFGWLHFGYGAFLVGVSCGLAVNLLSTAVSRDPNPGAPVLGLLLLVCAFAALVALVLGAVALTAGRVFCLRVPAGTRARPAAVVTLVASVLGSVLALGAVGPLWDAELLHGEARVSAVLAGCALLLGSWAAVVVGGFAFLAFLRRLARFLSDEAMQVHTARATRVLVGSLILVVVLGTAALVWAYTDAVSEMAAHDIQGQPLLGVLGRVHDVLVPRPGGPDWAQLARLGIALLNTALYFLLATECRAALRAGRDAIKTGLDRAAEPPA
jgi:hypothetical protein